MTDARIKLADAIRGAIPGLSPALFDAFATVPRERFLPDGPWQIRDATGTRVTEDNNPDHVYADASIAIDAARDLYNGQPSTVARWLDALNIARGERVLHIGCGSGYYAGILAETVGPAGRVFAVEVDEALARSAGKNLAAWPWVEVQHGDGITALPADIDVIIVHAGASHIRSEWLACTRAGVRFHVPITVDFPAMGPTLGKGLTFLLTRVESGWTAKALSFVAIYSMQSARDPSAAATFGEAMRQGGWDRITRLRTDAHEPGSACWCHWPDSCLS